MLRLGWTVVWAVVVTAMLAVSGPARALDPARAVTQYTLSTWDLEDGLPQSTVTAIAQTSEGFLWMGTQEGLVRFDGAAMTVLDRRSRVGLPHNFVSALAPRSRGGLWIGTYGGLAMLEGDKLSPVTLLTSTKRVTTLLETRGGVLWVGTTDGLARVMDGASEVYTMAEGLPHASVRALHEDRDGALWVGTDEGLAHWVDDRFETVALPGDRRVLSLDHGIDGELWIGTASGVVHGRPGHWRTRPDLEGAPVTSIAWDHDGNGWLAVTGRGIVRLKGGQAEVFGLADGLPNDDVLALYEDREHTVWLGTNGAGLLRLKDPPIVPLGMREGLSRDAVFAVIEGRDGSMWVGTSGGGLDHITDGVIRHLGTTEGLASNFIAALHESRDGSLWVGTKGHGIDHLIGSHISHYGVAEGLDGGDVFALEEDARGRLWAATELGLFRRDRGGHRFERETRVPADVVTALQSDREGTLWVGTQVHGLLLLGDRSGVRTFGTDDGLADPFVTTLQMASDGDVWVGTTRGLSHLHHGELYTFGLADGVEDQLILEVVDDRRGHLWVSSNRGLVRLPVDELEAAAAGHQPAITPLRFGVADGMRSSECNGGFHPAGLLTHDGRLWFPTMRGLVEVDPLRLAKTRAVPPVLMEGVVADHVPVLDPRMILEAGTRDVEIRYTGIGLDGPDKIHFRYRLLGFDEDWVEAGQRRVAYYTNLPPGRYTFGVVACNEDEVCSPVEAGMTITVEPHIYETASFYVIVVLLVAGTIVGGHRLRVRRMRAKARWLESAIQVRTVELQREVKVREEAEVALIEAKERAESARAVAEVAKERAEKAQAAAEQSARAKGEFLANMSHEIRTPMNAVMGMTDLVLATSLDENQRDMLTMARGAADGLLTILNDILDLSKIESGMLVMSPVTFSLRDRLDGALSVIRFKAQAKGLALDCTVADDVDPMLVGDPDRLRQILLNLLSNAVKFTPHGAVAVRVTMASSAVPGDGARELAFEVEDSGVGIPPERQAAIFEPFEQADGSSTRRFGGTGLGLSIAKKLVELMGGRISVRSVLGQGSCFRFTVRMEVGAALPQPLKAGHSLAPARSLEVLLAEDNLINQKVAVRILEKQGHKVVVAANGREAVEAAQSRRFDVILMDVHMPEMDGITATRAIRERERGSSARIPIVALTAGALQEDRELCMAAGMDAYLTKPVRADGLSEMLAAAVPAPRAGA